MKRIYITVDVECHDIDLVNNYIWGRVGDEEYGLRCILEQGRKHNIPINFFFDMCEAKRYGDDYAKSIINAIEEYSQPIYLHLHPNYLSGDDSRSFLWQYNYDEQYKLLQEGLAQYYELLKTDECRAFRAGRYGASAEMYTALDNLGVRLVDLSYGYKNEKMCHLTYDEVKTVNAPVMYQSQVVLPNTRFVCFDYFGKQKTLNTDIHEAQLQELKDVLRKSSDEDIVFTIHSWHFINRYFFKKGISGDKKGIKKFDKLIKYCKKQGYTFCDVGNENIRERVQTEEPETNAINNCKSFTEKIKSFFYNFARFQEIGKINKKYFKIFSLFYGGVALLAVTIIGLLLWMLL